MSLSGSDVPSAPSAPREPPKPLEPPAPSSEPTTSALPRTKRFWNWKLIVVEIIVTVLGGIAFLTQAQGVPGIVGLLVGLLGLGLLSREYRGIAVNAQKISMPTGWLRALPIIHLGRRKVHPGSVRELTVRRLWYSFQIVQIKGDFGSEVLVFQSRGQRLRFMKTLEKINPNVQMYRKMPPAAPL
jgi:hypothetical protein